MCSFNHRKFDRVATGVAGKVYAGRVDSIAKKKFGQIRQATKRGKAKKQVHILDVLSIRQIASDPIDRFSAQHNGRVYHRATVTSQQSTQNILVDQWPKQAFYPVARSVDEMHCGTDSHTLVMQNEIPILCRKPLGFGNIVGVHARDQRGARLAKPIIQRTHNTGVGTMNDANSSIQNGKLVKNTTGTIGGAVIYRNQFKIPETLPKHTGHGGAQIAGGVKHRHYYTDCGRSHE